MLSGYLRLNDSDYSTDNPFPILNNIHPQNTNKTNQTQHNRANKPFNDLNLEENMPQRILPRNSDSNISFSGQNQILKPQNIKRVKFPVPGSNNQNPINLQQFYKPSSRDTFNKNHNNNNFDLQSNNESLAVDSFQDQFPNNFKGNRPQKMQNQKYYRSPIKTGRDQEIYQMGMPIIENNQSQQENSRQNNHLNLQSYQQSQMLKYMDFDLITRIDPNLKKYQRESDVGQRSNSLSKPRHYRFTSQNFNQESSQNILVYIPDIKPQKQLPAAPKFIQTHRQLASLQPIVRNPITYDKNKNILQSPRYGLDMDLNQKSRYLNIPSLNRLNNYHSDTNYLKPLKTLNQSSQLPKQLISLRPRAKQANHNYSKSNLLNKNASNHSSIDRNYQQTKRNSSIDSLKQYQQQSQQSIEGSGSGEINNGIKRHRVGASERVMSNYRMYQQVEQDKERFKVKYQQYQPFTQPKRIWIPSVGEIFLLSQATDGVPQVQTQFLGKAITGLGGGCAKMFVIEEGDGYQGILNPLHPFDSQSNEQFYSVGDDDNKSAIIVTNSAIANQKNIQQQFQSSPFEQQQNFYQIQKPPLTNQYNIC